MEKQKPTRIYLPAPWPASPEPPAGRPGPPCFPPTRCLDSHSRRLPVAGLEVIARKQQQETNEVC